MSMTMIDAVSDIETMAGCLDVLAMLLDPSPVQLDARDREHLAVLLDMVSERQRVACQLLVSSAHQGDPATTAAAHADNPIREAQPA
jgi:dsDNA-binding SOS-regulon protein